MSSSSRRNPSSWNSPTTRYELNAVTVSDDSVTFERALRTAIGAPALSRAP